MPQDNEQQPNLDGSRPTEVPAAPGSRPWDPAVDNPPATGDGEAGVTVWDELDPDTDPFDPNYVPESARLRVPVSPVASGPAQSATFAEPPKVDTPATVSPQEDPRLGSISNLLASEFGDVAPTAIAPNPADEEEPEAPTEPSVPPQPPSLPEMQVPAAVPPASAPPPGPPDEVLEGFELPPPELLEGTALGPEMEVVAEMPDEAPVSAEVLAAGAVVATAAGVAALPAQSQAADEPFFPIPDSVPELPHEDTADVQHDTRRRRRRPARRGPAAVFVNLIIWGLLLTCFAAMAGAALYAKYARDRLYSEQPEVERNVILTVNAGDKLPQIIDQLREKQVLRSYMGVDDGYLLRFLARVNENSHMIKAGVYKISNTMSLNDLYGKLLKGSQDFKVTIPEGKSAAEVAELIAAKNEEFQTARFLELTTETAFIRSLQLEVPSLEGYLYPSTYYFGPGIREEDMLRKMVETFRDVMQTKLAGVEKRDALTFQEHMIMASLIEREARLDEDRPLIASVIFNRLKRGMQLQIDATVHYALNAWNRRLSYDDLKVDSPYNTYKIKGLPPGPICSPRAASILATFQAPETEYLFYVLKGDGKHVFSKTAEEHNRNKAFFRKAQQEALAASVKAAATGTEPPAADPESTAPMDLREPDPAPKTAEKPKATPTHPKAAENPKPKTGSKTPSAEKTKKGDR